MLLQSYYCIRGYIIRCFVISGVQYLHHIRSERHPQPTACIEILRKEIITNQTQNPQPDTTQPNCCLYHQGHHLVSSGKKKQKKIRLTLLVARDNYQSQTILSSQHTSPHATTQHNPTQTQHEISVASIFCEVKYLVYQPIFSILFFVWLFVLSAIQQQYLRLNIYSII